MGVQLPPRWSIPQLWGRWEELTPEGVSLVQMPGQGVHTQHFAGMADPGSSCLEKVVRVFGASGKRSELVFGPRANGGDVAFAMSRLFDTMGKALITCDDALLGGLPQGMQATIAAGAHHMFSLSPLGRVVAGTPPTTCLCMPYHPGRVGKGTGMTINPDGYLVVYIGSCTDEHGHRHVLQEYAHRLVAAGSQGGDWRIILNLAPNQQAPKFEVSHTCGNAWCLNPAHLRVVATPKDNVITLLLHRPMSL